MPISDDIRRIIRESTLSQYEIAKRAGIPQSTLTRLMAGRNISTASLDRLQKPLRLKVSVIKSSSKSKGK